MNSRLLFVMKLTFRLFPVWAIHQHGVPHSCLAFTLIVLMPRCSERFISSLEAFRYIKFVFSHPVTRNYYYLIYIPFQKQYALGLQLFQLPSVRPLGPDQKQCSNNDTETTKYLCIQVVSAIQGNELPCNIRTSQKRYAVDGRNSPNSST